MALSNDPFSRMARLLLIGIMVLAWSQGPAARAQEPGANAPPENSDPAALADGLERYFRAAEAAHRTTPRETFDVAAVAASAENDPNALLEWVRDRTVWVPYRGALRGPLGVLMDRRGNSLDRATLLAELLRSGGKTVRLARASLPPATAADLLKALPQAPKVPVPSDAPLRRDTIDLFVEQYAKPFGLDPVNLKRAAEHILTRGERVKEDMVQRAAEQSTALSDMVWPEDAAAPASGDAATEALADHWWVQVKDGDRWNDLDVLAYATPDLPPAETIDWAPKDGTLPLESGLCHEVVLRVVVEQLVDGRLAERTVLEQPLRPCEVAGQHVSVSHSPRTWPADLDLAREADPAAKIKLLAAAEREWLPVIAVGEKLYYEGSFTDAGDVNPKANLDEFKKTGKNIAGAGDVAAGLLDAGPAPTPAAPATSTGLLTAEWLEYEIRVPGRDPQRVRRQLFDLPGPAARAAGKVAGFTVDEGRRLDRGLALLGRVEILPLMCDLTPAFVQHVGTTRMAALRGPLLSALRAPGADKPSARMVSPASTPLPGTLYDIALLRQSLNPHKDVLYLDRPNVLSLHGVLRRDAAGKLTAAAAVDIVANATAVARAAAPDVARRARLAGGVLDTSAETILIGDDRAPNVSDLLAADADAGRWMVVRRADDAQWADAAVSPDLRARVNADLADGFVAVVPRVGAGGVPGWWRIDPATGHTLGMGESGWGTSMTERAILFFLVWDTCEIASIAAGKIGPGAPAGSGPRQAIACALLGLGVGAGVSAMTADALLIAAATGLGAGYAI